MILSVQELCKLLEKHLNYGLSVIVINLKHLQVQLTRFYKNIHLSACPYNQTCTVPPNHMCEYILIHQHCPLVVQDRAFVFPP